jgi:hypothetical protein
MSEHDKELERLRATHRATARYSIYRHRMADDGYGRVKEPLDYANLTFDEAHEIVDRLNKEAGAAAGNPTDSWGLTMYNFKLETSLPPRWTPPTAQH